MSENPVGDRLNGTTVALIALSIVIGLTRLLAISATLWEWDEALFCAAVRHYDVAAHQPHPLGFPLYILFAKAIRLVVPSDFRALQTENILAAFLLFPGMYLLARAFGFERRSAAVAGLIFSFLPNVWYYGGTAFSDIPAVVAIIFAVALLLAGRDSDAAWWGGCIMLGVAVAFRPQNALMGVYPWCVTSWWRIRRSTARPPSRRLAVVIFGTVLALAIGCGSYIGAALASSSWSDYIRAARAQSKWVMDFDSYRNPVRPGIVEMFRVYFGVASDAGKASVALSVLAGIGLLRGGRPALRSLLTFGPFLIFALFMLGYHGAPRLSIGVMPLLALLASEGGSVLGQVLAMGRPRTGIAVYLSMVIVILVRLITWTWPALREVRSTAAPTVAAPRWIRSHLDRSRDTLYVHRGLWPFGRYFLSDYNPVWVEDDFRPASVVHRENAWLLREEAGLGSDAIRFQRSRSHIWNLSAHRYFEIAASPIASSAEFREGWATEQTLAEHVPWRTMSGSSRMILPGLGGTSELTLRFAMPLIAEDQPETVAISIDGETVDRFAPKPGTFQRSYRFVSRPTSDEIQIDTGRRFNMAFRNGKRTCLCSMQLLQYEWRKAPPG